MSANDDARTRAEERIDALLADRATQGLSSAEEQALATWLAENPDVDPESFERAAAALELAMSARDRVAMPAHVRARVLASAPIASASKSRGRLVLVSGWLAAAAAVLLALFLWTRGASKHGEHVDELVARIEHARDVVRAPWKATDDPEGRAVRGEVVWSASEQRGYLRLAGLPANDPSARQYQLWVFDAQRDDRYPIDGGVFDVPSASGEVLVPIDARLPVAQAKLFALTIERPGGVVVSQREHLVALASL